MTCPWASASSAISSNSRRVRSTLTPPTNAWNWSGRTSTSPTTSGPASTRASARLRRRTTASTRAISSSGWHGFVTQSSAPRRRPRTRWATEDCPVHTTTPSCGSRAQSFSRYVHACGPSTARSSTTALSRMATSASSGTGEASTRCCHPAVSSRFVNTCRNPLSESTTARRMAACVVVVIAPPAYAALPTPTRLQPAPVTAWSQPVYTLRGDPAISGDPGSHVRGVGELAEQARHDERDLLADVDRVVADPLQRAGHEHHRHRPLAAILVGPDLDRPPEHLAVQRVDLLVLADQILRQRHVAERERVLGLRDLRAGQPRHLEDPLHQLRINRRLVAHQRHHLGDVHALVAHPLGVLDHVQQRGDRPQVAGHRRLQREEREDPLMHLEEAAVDPVVVVDDDRRQLDVLVLERLQRAVQRGDHEIERAEGLLLERP